MFDAIDIIRLLVPDKYADFAEVAQNKICGRDFRLRFRRPKTTILVLAPHGGSIEPGTSEIADSIAGNDYCFYAFEGLRATGNHELHITSTRFDEPTCVALASSCHRTIAIHGEASFEDVVFAGGRDQVLMDAIRGALVGKGFHVAAHNNPGLQGQHRMNICNRNGIGAGVQLELSKGLRRSFFSDLTTSGRRHKTVRFYNFVDAVRLALNAIRELPEWPVNS